MSLMGMISVWLTARLCVNPVYTVHCAVLLRIYGTLSACRCRSGERPKISKAGEDGVLCISGLRKPPRGRASGPGSDGLWKTEGTGVLHSGDEHTHLYRDAVDQEDAAYPPHCMIKIVIHI